MKRWEGCLAVVTGASAGLGADIAKQLAIHGMIVVGLARRVEMIEQLAKKISCTAKGKLHAMRCDVTDGKQLKHTFKCIDERYGPISVIVNNAGLLRACNFKGHGDPKGWKEVLDTNVLGVLLCSRFALKSMVKHNVKEGQFINMNSIYGFRRAYPPVLDHAIYFASKHAITVLTDALRQEISEMKKNIRVSSLSPGWTRTDILKASGDKKTQEMKIFDKWKVLDPEHITNGVIYILSSPEGVNITQLTIQAVGEFQ